MSVKVGAMDTSSGSPLLLSATETARQLGVARSTLYEWSSSGRVPAPIRIGRRTLWRADDLRAWVDAGCPGRMAWERQRQAS